MRSTTGSLAANHSSTSGSTLHSMAKYIEDYMDLVENTPNDIARHMTRLHEHNQRYHQLMARLESSLDTICDKRAADALRRPGGSLSRIQRSLIEIQEIADEKLLLIQTILDKLETKGRQLDADSRSVTSYSTASNARPPPMTSTVSADTLSASQPVNGTNTSAKVSHSLNTTNKSSDNLVAKDIKTGTVNGVPKHVSTSSSHSTKRASARLKTGSGNHDNSYHRNKWPKRSLKRRLKTSHKELKRSKNSSLSAMNGTNKSVGECEEEAGAHIDPDEPTYCLCKQVSYGEMICCDNSDCKIEWFHFPCVSLAVKPKGKWFCPKCRRDRSGSGFATKAKTLSKYKSMRMSLRKH